jgi:hypothetical protein
LDNKGLDASARFEVGSCGWSVLVGWRSGVVAGSGCGSVTVEDSVVSGGRGAGTGVGVPSKRSTGVKVLGGVVTITVVNRVTVLVTSAAVSVTKIDTTEVIVAQVGPLPFDTDGSLASVAKFSVVSLDGSVSATARAVSASSVTVGSVTVDSVGVGSSIVIVIVATIVVVTTFVGPGTTEVKVVVITSVQAFVVSIGTVFSGGNVTSSDVFVAVSFEYLGVRTETMHDQWFPYQKFKLEDLPEAAHTIFARK